MKAWSTSYERERQTEGEGGDESAPELKHLHQLLNSKLCGGLRLSSRCVKHKHATSCFIDSVVAKEKTAVGDAG